MFCSIVEYSSPDSIKYYNNFVPRIATLLKDDSPDVLQVSTFFVGVAALHGGPGYAQFCVESLQQLFAIANHPGSRHEDYNLVTDNAVSAIGKVYKAYHNSNAFDANHVLGSWYQMMRIEEDEDEAVFVYGLLVELVERLFF